MKKNEIKLTLSRDEARMLFRAAHAFRAHTAAEHQVVMSAERRLREAIPEVTSGDMVGYDIVNRLYDGVRDTAELDDMLHEAGILWRCLDDNCRADNPEYAEACEDCELPKGAEPADEEPDEGDGSHDLDEED